MSVADPWLISCNGADLPPRRGKSETSRRICLSYVPSSDAIEPSLRIQLAQFVRQKTSLPDRLLDLLEIAAYVYGADRSVFRGPKDALEYGRWGRTLHFYFRVRDCEFWSDASVKEALSKCLLFMGGDKEISFTFQPGHKTPPTSLFDSDQCVQVPDEPASIILFSGGVDSFTGAVERLVSSHDNTLLISHQSGQPSVARTQNRLAEYLARKYPDRVQHYKFKCGLARTRAREESQRYRAFLYTAIGLAVVHNLPGRRIFVYENGVTAINLRRRQDLLNARASRTTHPKTLGLLAQLYSVVAGGPVVFETPFFWRTKAGVIQRLQELGELSQLNSTVSCSKTFQRLGQATHCGGCYQCIDRKFAAYAIGVDDNDDGAGMYSTDFLTEPIGDGDTRSALLDYVRQGIDLATLNVDCFCDAFLEELADIVPHIEGEDESIKLERIYSLHREHGEGVLKAIRRMRAQREDLCHSLPRGSFLQMVAGREYLKEPVERLMDAMSERLCKAIPLLFQRTQPESEADLNDKIEGLLSQDWEDYNREHPGVRFGLAKAIPDHSLSALDLWIEAKYLRKKTTPSKATEGISADLTKYPKEVYKLFIVYDPERAIPDDGRFASPFERISRTKVCIVR